MNCCKSCEKSLQIKVLSTYSVEGPKLHLQFQPGNITDNNFATSYEHDPPARSDRNGFAILIQLSHNNRNITESIFLLSYHYLT
jgi:hypothetical protein